jgi:hexosaminidase
MNTDIQHNTFSETNQRFPWIGMSPTVLHATPQVGLVYSINSSTRILINDECLRSLATRLAYGLTGAAELETPPQILLVSDTSAQARASDIELRLSSPDTGDVAIPVHGADETYRIDITQPIRVTAQNSGAMARALTSLHKAARVSTVLDPAVIIDAPVYAERSVMIDMGRRQFSPDWMICLLREMAWNQLNTLHLHLTDNEGVRVIFPSHPDISSDDAWSAGDLKRVLDTAAAYHIEVIPELDMPGHMDWILRNRPQWQLKLNNGSVVSKAIDFSIAPARNFLKSLFTDLMEMFPQSRYIHLGADEYFLQPITPDNTPQLAQYVRDETGNLEADSEDAVRYFINSLAELVQEKGKIARIWNDSAVKRRQVIALKKQVQIECWSIWGSRRGELNAQELVDAGYTVLNAHGDFYFIINKAWDNLFHAKHSPHGIYDVWRANHFMDNAGASFTEIPSRHPAMAGAGVQLWIEVPTFSSPEEMWTQFRSWLLPLGQRTWDSPNAANRFKELPLIALAVANPPPVPWQ